MKYGKIKHRAELKQTHRRKRPKKKKQKREAKRRTKKSKTREMRVYNFTPIHENK